jgi:hypothetical protein
MLTQVIDHEYDIEFDAGSTPFQVYTSPAAPYLVLFDQVHLCFLG